MLLRPISVLALVGAICAFVSNAPAQSPPASPAQRQEVRAWLLRIHEAASHRNFQGTFVVSGGGVVSSARIAHFAEGRNEYERSESLDGQARYVAKWSDALTINDCPVPPLFCQSQQLKEGVMMSPVIHFTVVVSSCK